MDDGRIVELYWERSEKALTETQIKYGNYLSRISYNILNNTEDARECVNDTYLDAWNSMPPHRPSVLSVFLGKITRRISIDCWRKNNADKRGGGELTLAYHELEDCVSGKENVENEIERKELICSINRFLEKLPVTERRLFLRRYWFMDSVKSIARAFGFSESKVTSMLFRTRSKLRLHLEKEGYM